MNEDLPPSDQLQTNNKDTRARSRDPLVGTVLDGRFEIEGVLGSGGMSVVYKATQLRVNRHVAIKTLKLQLDTKPVYRERFQREISSLCTLNHPNIVTVYDCIIGPDDQPYIVMDYLRGRSLEALIEDEGPMSVERFARIAIQICSALEHAHKRGIIHRDLKPGNVVLMDDEMDFVKVVDFGLAKIGDQNKRLTHSGELWGSPPYMSPEQCMGEAQDQRSDLYSIGAVMYEMLTGVDPFPNATTVFEFIKSHTSLPPPAMISANNKVNIPAKVEAVVRKALEKDPGHRYQSAKEMQDAIVEASSASVDREKREFLFHLANQASIKPISGQSVLSGEQNENARTASEAFKRALNPFTDGQIHGETAPAAGQPEAESLSPSVQRWRSPGMASPPQSEIVQPIGEIVQPTGEIVRPTGDVVQPASAVTPPEVPHEVSSGTSLISGMVPAAPVAPSLSHSSPTADAPTVSNPWLFLVLLVAVAFLIYVSLPALTGRYGKEVRSEPSATVQSQGNGIDGINNGTVSDGQSTTGQSYRDKVRERHGLKSLDGSNVPKNRARHPHFVTRDQGLRSTHPALTTQTGASQAHAPSSATTTNASPPASAHPAKTGGKADPWSTLEKLR